MTSKIHPSTHRVSCITAWYGSYAALDCIALQRVVKTTHSITGRKLPAIHDIYFEVNTIYYTHFLFY